MPDRVAYAFQDEFTGAAGTPPDPAKWTHQVGHWGANQELETYTRDIRNCFQDGHGNLVIRALRETSGGHTTYTSARIVTKDTFTRNHGTFEARLKVDCQPGLWPAFWLLGMTGGWPAEGEIDVLEVFGNGVWSPAATSIHSADEAGKLVSKVHPVAIDNAWHVWRLWYDQNTGRLRFYKDGVQYLTLGPGDMPVWRFGSPGVPGIPVYMLLNLAVGGTGGGAVPAGMQFPVDFLIDYVRVW